MNKKGLIGIQMMMLKGKVEELGAYETLKRCAKMGYHCIEVSQIPMTSENVAGIKKACDEFNIKIAALSAALEPMFPGAKGEFLVSDFDKIVNDCKTLNCNLLRIGMLPMNCMGSKEKALGFAKRADEVAKKLSEHGIELYYHNHHIEFVKYDGQYLLDIIRDNTTLGFEIDVHWCQRAGLNPITVLENYAGRIKLVHLKDYRVAEVVMPENPADHKQFFAAFVGNVQFAEVGEGNLPMKEIIDTGFKCGGKYFLIEQDDQYGRDPFECLEISRKNLIKLGYESWFLPN